MKRLNGYFDRLVGWLIPALLIGLLLGACAQDESTTFTPAADQPNLLYFYTEN